MWRQTLKYIEATVKSPGELEKTKSLLYITNLLMN